MHTFSVAGVLLVVSVVATPQAVRAAEKIDFSSQVQPLLSKYCYACHGPDQQKSGLRLDRREAAIKPAESDERSIVPGDPVASRLLKVIDGRDAELSMPPKGAKLAAAQVELIRTWIAQGAEYNQHWAFVAPKRPALPAVKQKDWPRNAIDHFILAKLERENLSPSPEAQPHVLVRRVYLDLIGIAPTPEEADAFVKEFEQEKSSGFRVPGSELQDKAKSSASPTPTTRNSSAYERLVDRLLASPHYGERWARKWLDMARYADTNGYEKDRVRSIWPYRDWVIGAINDDRPFDQFTIEQIAGDLLSAPLKPQASSPTPQSPLVATGFHRNTMINEEGGIDVEEFRYLSVVDRVNTTSAVWLGLTLGCAQCHTHKYDPITHKEYFQLYAFFNNADEPEAEVMTPQLITDRATHAERVRNLEQSLADRFPAGASEAIAWSVLEPVSTAAESRVKLQVLDDHSILAHAQPSEKDVYTIKATTEQTDIVAIKLEALTHRTLPGTGPGRAPNGNFVLSEFSLTAAENGKPQTSATVDLRTAEADASQANFEIINAIDGNAGTGWAIDDGSGQMNKARSAVFHFTKPLSGRGGSELTVTLSQQHGAKHLLGRFRILVGRRIAPAATGDAPIEVQRKQHLDAQLQAWIEANTSSARKWTTLKPTQITGWRGGTFITQADDAVLVQGDNPNQNIYTFKTQTALDNITAIRLEVLPDASLPNGGPGRAPLFSDGDFHLGEFKVEAAAMDTDAAMTPVVLHEASHSYAQEGRSAAKAIDGDLDTAWSIKGSTGREHQAVFVMKEPLRNAKGFKLNIVLDQRYIHQMTIGRFRLSVTGDALPVKANTLPAAVENVLALPQAKWSEKDRSVVREHFLRTTPLLADAHKELAQLRASAPRGVKTMVMAEREPAHARTTHIHKRGEFLQTADVVEPGVLSILHPLPVAPKSATRLDLARWLVDPKNPMVGRVVMNRQWHSFFGRGIVRTTEDFGLQGEKPSHPDLLDWLAVQFMEGSSELKTTEPTEGSAPTRNSELGTRNSSAWSLKQMHKLIVMSATYRQSSRVSPLLIERDPTNQWLSRGPRIRVEAEMIRDSALSASGLLSRRIGGPSVFPPQPEGVTSLGYGGFHWATATGENRYRRGLYTFAKRTTPFAAFVTFDGPTGDTCLVRRDRSNTPLQALTMMNDPVFVEASQALARRVLSEEGKTDDARTIRLFRQVLTREPTQDELTALREFLVNQRERLGKAGPYVALIAGPAIPKGIEVKELAAWTTLARVVMNLDEAVTKE